MRIPRIELEPAYLRGDCTHFVLKHLGLPINPGEIPGVILDRFVDKLSITSNQEWPSIILYNRRPYPRHWGFALNGRVVSKWGLGPVFEHDIDDVLPLWKSPHGYVQYMLPEEYHHRINTLFDK